MERTKNEGCNIAKKERKKKEKDKEKEERLPTIVSPWQECRQCRASSELLPPPGRQLELHMDSSFSTEHR